ncbi:glycosyltransferase [Candidatus Microthrix parvicella]|uniref:glycosyltransferase n=1 Tax=Candidatus Neomicrothrix parvicella TaxID=41950 RepID=UPI00036981D8|nr:glycosyltransferase [Candidatus Microthrix parvicella]
MRILQVATSSLRRGAEVFAAQLGSELGRRGHEVTTISLEHRNGEHGLAFEELAVPGRGPRAVLELARRARACDVLIAHGGSTLLPVAIAAKLARRPFVYRNIGDPSFWGRSRGAALRIGAPLRSAAQVVALYPDAADYMREHYRLPDERLVVAPNAVDVDRFAAATSAQRRSVRAELSLPPTQIVLGYLGNLSEEKRPGWALATVEALEDATLLMAGDGPLRAELDQRARSLGTRESTPACRLLGPVSDPQRFLAAIDVLLLPSATEGIPGVLVEAALVGVPTVATDVGGVRDALTTMSAGVCVPVDDFDGFVAAVRGVAADPGGYRPDRDAALEHHAIEAVADRWEQVVLQVGG